MAETVYYTPDELGVNKNTTVDDILGLVAERPRDIFIRWLYGEDKYIITKRIAGDPMRYDSVVYDGLNAGPIKNFGGLATALKLWEPYNELLKKAAVMLIWRDSR